MKKRITLSALVAFAALTVPISTFAQEDSLVMPRTTPDTVVKEREIIREPAVVQQTVAAAPAEAPKDQRPPLRVGEVGVRYMPSFSTLALRTQNGETVQGDLTMSQGYGIMAGLNISKHVGLRAELNYLQIHQKYKDVNLEREVGVSYLNIPVMLTLNTDKTAPVNFLVEAGPQFGLNVGSQVKSTSTGRDSQQFTATVGAKQGDVGLAYGTGLEFMLNRAHTLRFDIGFRGFVGLFNLSGHQTSNDPDSYNVLVKASRKTYAGYGGLTFCF